MTCPCAGYPQLTGPGCGESKSEPGGIHSAVPGSWLLHDRGVVGGRVRWWVQGVGGWWVPGRGGGVPWRGGGCGPCPLPLLGTAISTRTPTSQTHQTPPAHPPARPHQTPPATTHQHPPILGESIPARRTQPVLYGRFGHLWFLPCNKCINLTLLPFY